MLRRSGERAAKPPVSGVLGTQVGRQVIFARPFLSSVILGSLDIFNDNVDGVTERFGRQLVL